LLSKGLVGVRFDNELHLCYQSHDCGPEGLGAEVVSFVRKLQKDSLRMKIFKENIRKVEWVDEIDNPTTEQAEKLIRDPEILQFLKYNEAWHTQFSFDPMTCFEYVILFGLPIIPEHREYSLGEPTDFIAYAYVVDLNRDVLELYRSGHKLGEFSFQALVDLVKADWGRMSSTWEDY
jgi:hypothetical protein